MKQSIDSSLFLLSMLILAGLCASACTNSDSDAPPPSVAAPALAKNNPATNQDLEGAWLDVQAKAKNPELTAHARVRAMEKFLLEFSSKHKYSQDAKTLYKKLQADVKSEEEAQKKRAAKHNAQRKKDQAQRIKTLQEGPLTEIGAVLVFQLASWAGKPNPKDPLQGVTLRLGQRQKVVGRPVRYGLGFAREALRSALKEDLPTLFDTKLEYTQGTNLGINTLLRKRLGGDLFSTQKPGALDPKAVQTMLQQFDLTPQSPFLGTTAAEVYEKYKAPVRQYALIHDAMTRYIGRKKVRKSYEEAAAKHADGKGGTKYEMVDFYRTYAQENQIASRAGIRDDIWSTYVPVGFWMRRIADGSEPALATFLEKNLKTFDPEFYQKLREKRKQ